jgi:hypothetical protein
MLAMVSLMFCSIQLSLTTYLVAYFNGPLSYTLMQVGLVLSVAQAGGVSGLVLWGYTAEAYLRRWCIDRAGQPCIGLRAARFIWRLCNRLELRLPRRCRTQSNHRNRECGDYGRAGLHSNGHGGRSGSFSANPAALEQLTTQIRKLLAILATVSALLILHPRARKPERQP